jgi:hypothetical protein
MESSKLKTILNFIPKIIEVIDGIPADLISNAPAIIDRECKVDLWGNVNLMSITFEKLPGVLHTPP